MRTTVQSAGTMEEEGGALLDRALDPKSWALPAATAQRVSGDNACMVGPVQVCAAVDVMPTLDTFIRVSFRGPELTPMQAAEYLEQFTACRFPFVRNAEWLVEIDSRKWIHFSRRYTPATLEA